MQKDMNTNTDAMIEVCRRYVVSPDLHAILPEPYIPHIPDDWNGLLVLAESQNLASAGEYRERLEKASPEDRFLRLPWCTNGEGVGVQPWDDGHLKIAVKAALDADPARTAVSNAVPWSQQKKPKVNVNPSVELEKQAVCFWSELLPLLKPERIVTAGKVANRTLRQAADRIGLQVPVICWRLPSPHISMASVMFFQDDLLARYPEVDEVIKRHPDWLGNKYQQNKVFFACHAVSLTKKQAQ